MLWYRTPAIGEIPPRITFSDQHGNGPGDEHRRHRRQVEEGIVDGHGEWGPGSVEKIHQERRQHEGGPVHRRAVATGRQPEVPDGPGPLSFSIAHYLNLPTIAKQRLLEVPASGERLKYEIPLLEGANTRIRDELIKRNPYQGPRLN